MPRRAASMVKTAQIPLRNGGFALVDAADYDDLARFNWRSVQGSKGKPYLHRNVQNADGSRTYESMRRRLIGVPGLWVDHIDGDTFNNTRANLRLCTPSENARNRKAQAGSSSRFVGVTLLKRNGKWQASIEVKGRHVHIGHFASETEAALARDRVASATFGEFAKLNFVGGVPCF